VEIHESGSRTGETENCQARVYRVLVEDGVYYYVGWHQQEAGLVCFTMMIWRPRIGWRPPLDKQTYPIELMNHIIEVGMVARAKWGVGHKVYKLKGGPFVKEKSVRKRSGAPGTIERFAEMAEAFTRFGVNLR